MFSREEVKNYLSVVVVVVSVVAGISALVGSLVWLDQFKDRRTESARQAEVQKLAQAMRQGKGNIFIVARVYGDPVATANDFNMKASWAGYYGWRSVDKPTVSADGYSIFQHFVKP